MKAENDDTKGSLDNALRDKVKPKFALLCELCACDCVVDL